MTTKDESCVYCDDALTVFVVGASGDLAAKKTYPSLFELYRHHFLPQCTTICGYARSAKTDDEFRQRIRSYLKEGTETEKQAFLNMCIYRSGKYDSAEDVKTVFAELQQIEKNSCAATANRLFYFAIPPSVFVPIGTSIKTAVIAPQEAGEPGTEHVGWNRLIIEKPFGKDLESFEELNAGMSRLYKESEIYRIDHYLGKEMVKNLLMLRFSNQIFEPLWNRDHISSVMITFKEDFGTKGRGGYFNDFGIVRDILQNHLLQVLSLVAMEPPVALAGEAYSSYVRNEKVKVLHCIQPVKLENTVLGQYLAAPDGSEPAYVDEPDVPSDSVTPTFASMVLFVDNPRWDGVPFILKAGKALNERKAEIRVQFRKPPGVNALLPGESVLANELVLRLQPDEAVYMKVNVKEPGLKTRPVASELDLTYKKRFDDSVIFDAYTRLILDVLRGSQAAFVRDDELRAAWHIFTPLLHQIEKEHIRPIPYAYGGRGPAESDEMLAKFGYEYHGGEYIWQPKSKM